MLAWNMSKSISATKSYAREARGILGSLEQNGKASPAVIAEARAIADALDMSAERADFTWGLIRRAVGGADPELFEPPEQGITIIRNHGPDAALCQQLHEIWGNSEPSNLARELFERLKQLPQG